MVSRTVVMPFAQAFEIARANLAAAIENGWDKRQVLPLEIADRMTRDARMMAANAAINKPEAVSVYESHLEMLQDPMIKDTVEEYLAQGMDDLAAIRAARDSICDMFSHIDDEYLKARVDDVRDVFRRIINTICGGDAQATCPITFEGVKDDRVILVAEELLPSDTMSLDFSRVAGILCHKGSATSHVCIISHAKGVPIQIGVDISGISSGDIVEVDDPMVGASSLLKQVRAARRRLYVNASNLDEVRTAIENGAEGIGLFRSEFFFMDRTAMPGYEEQLEFYKEALRLCKGRPFNLRLLDVGGDKMLPYVRFEKEENPFMGVRGVRFLLKHKEILKTQLDAAMDAAKEYPGQLSILVPMVSTVEEVQQVREMMGDTSEGLVRLGVMIETPASVLCAPGLAAVCDFFSVGTNDLTQYVMAVDRSNAEVTSLYDPLSPAMCSALAITVDAAHAAGIPVGICGELASDPRATEFLLDLGVNALSIARL